MAEENLDALEAGRLLAGLPAAVVVHDGDGIVHYLNEAAERMYGWQLGELAGRPLTQVLYADPAARDEAVAELRRVGQWRGRLLQSCRDGGQRFIDSRQTLLGGKAGEPELFLCVNIDITGDLESEDAARRAHHVRSSAILAGGIAHELNNALAPILLAAAMMKRSFEDEKTLRMVSMIEKSARRGSDLVRHILNFERGRGGGDDLIRQGHFERLLNGLVDDTLPSHIEPRVNVAQDLWDLTGNYDELSGVFSALLANAVEAMPDGGELRIEAVNRRVDQTFEGLAPEAHAGTYVSVVVRDSGCGIDTANIDRVAEPLFTTKEPAAGHGLGLSSAQGVVKGHGGFMLIESEGTNGTTVTVCLPAQAPEDETEGEGGSRGSGELVLVADDEFFVRETIKRTLEDLGYSVIAAEDGAGALALYAQRMNDIAMVVTNIDMPYMDGPSLCRALFKINPEVRILISSGHRGVKKVREVKAAGVKHFLPKPYTAENLAATVSGILRGDG